MLKSKMIWTFVLLFVTSLAIAKPDPTATLQPNLKPIKLGVIYNLSGAMKIFDAFALNGAKLAVTEINSKGGILGRKLKLEIVDGKTNIKSIVKAAKKIAALTDDADIVLGMNDTDMAIAAIPSIMDAKKLFITSGATSPKLSAFYPRHVFLACFSDNNQATAAAEFAIKQLQAKNILLVTQHDSEYALLLAQYFRNSFTQLRGNLLGHTNFTSDKPTISKYLAKLKRHKQVPDAFYLSSGSTTAINIIKEIRRAGFHQPIIGGDGLELPDLTSKVDPDFNDIYYTAHALITKDNPDPVVQRFIKAYTKAYNKAPDTSFAALGYDTINLIAQALQNAKSTNAEKIRAALLRTRNFVGVTGSISYVNESTIPLKSVTIVKLQNGKRSLAQKWP